ncbi:MAG: glucoamylase family protein, partial [Limisphaerales bacterium]
PHVRGFLYHFPAWATGDRVWKCELSSIDSAILMCGVLCCRSHFNGREGREIRRLATEMYERVEWPWMLNGGATFSMGWFPEASPRGVAGDGEGKAGVEGEGGGADGGRFLENRWDHYCELMMLYLLALGSPTHPVGPETWSAWSRPVREFHGHRFVWSPAPLFVHQFSHAWFDFRGRRDAGGVDWFQNSMAATLAHRAWCLERSSRFPRWSEDLWGVTSSDSEKGYTGWGGPPDSGPLDGTIVPCAAAGSMPFAPVECLRTLRHQRERYGDRIWTRYGFVDAFNPHTGWVNPDVIGIDVGITMLMAENARTGLVWRTMGSDGDPRRGMKRVFRT